MRLQVVTLPLLLMSISCNTTEPPPPPPPLRNQVAQNRYFDYHHSDHDTIDKVHPRELEMGAIVEAILCYLISEQGL